MTSKLTRTEFELRLKKLTRKGEPTIMGTPFAILTAFNFSDKPFYGEFNQTEFRITRNKALPIGSGYIVHGRFDEFGSKTKLDYQIKPIIFSYYWVRIVPIIGFLLFNGILLYFKIFVWSIFLTLNGFLMIMVFGALTVEKYQRKSIERRFIEEFEVES